MPNINMLKGKIIEKGLNIDKLAEKIGIDKSTMYRKFAENAEKFSVKEANQVVSILGLTGEEAMRIFFDTYVA